MYPSQTDRGWIYPFVRRVQGGYYCGYPSFPVTQTIRDEGSQPWAAAAAAGDLVKLLLRGWHRRPILNRHRYRLLILFLVFLFASTFFPHPVPDSSYPDSNSVDLLAVDPDSSAGEQVLGAGRQAAAG